MAQSDDALELQRLLDVGRFADAEGQIAFVLPRREANGAPVLGEAWRIAAEVAVQLGNVDAAVDRSARAVAHAEANQAGPRELSAALNVAGMALMVHGDAAAAMEPLRAAHRLRASTLGQDSEPALESELNLATAASRLDQPGDAIAALQRVIRVSAAGSRSRAVAQSALATRYATEPATRSLSHDLYLAAYEAALAAFGHDHPAAAMISVNLASSEIRNGNLRRAMALLLTADEVFQRSFGVDHPQNAVALIVLGRAYRRAGDHPNERAVLDRALRLRWSAFGPRDHRTIEVVRHLVAALADLSGADSIAMIEASVLARVRDAVDVQESSIGQSRIGPERADRELAAYLDRAVEPRPDPDQTPMGTYGELHLMSVDEVATATGDSSDWRWLVPLRRLGRERQAEGRRADSLRITELAVGVMARVYGSDHIAIIHERNRLGTALTEEFGPRAGLPAFEAAAGAFDSLPGAPAGLATRALALRRLAASHQRELDPVGITTRRRLARESVSDRAASILGALDDLDRLVERRDLQEWIAIKAELPLLLADDPYVVASASDGLSRLLFEGGLHSSAGATIVALARVAARADSPANARAAGLCVSILASARERAGRRPAWVKQILALGGRELDGWRELGLAAGHFIGVDGLD